MRPNSANSYSTASVIDYCIRLVALNQGISPTILSAKYNSSGLKKLDPKIIQKFPVLNHDDMNAWMGDSQHHILNAIFFLTNCVQEYQANTSKLDRIGRFKYASSYQSHSKSIDQNNVQELIDQLMINIGIKPIHQKTSFFISHDIDFLYGSRKEDLKWAARNWKVGYLIKIIFQEIIKKPHWRNIDRVIALDSEYDIRSTFFWLVNEGEGLDRIPNADYNIRKEEGLLELVTQRGCYNGLHKSASKDSFDEEINKSKMPWNYNRNHYLRFNTHDHWTAISESSIELDCSLGFAEHFGFRNSYGKPFTPFDIKNDRPYDFVEAPLHVMDATFLHYLKTEPEKIGSTVIDFIEKNKQDCVLSILWHNNYLTDFAYKPFLRAYKEILGYIYDNQFETISPDEIIEQYSVKQPD